MYIKPTYDTITLNYFNGNRKDFACQVKLYGLDEFINRVRNEVTGSILSAGTAFDMLYYAVKLGEYK